MFYRKAARVGTNPLRLTITLKVNLNLAFASQVERKPGLRVAQHDASEGVLLPSLC